MITYKDEYLMHYGIPGMRWGVRRYQNPDGSLTAKGKKRYSTVELKKKSAERGDAAADARNLYSSLQKQGKALQDRFDKAQYTLEKAYAKNPQSAENAGVKQTLKSMKKMRRKVYRKSALGKVHAASIWLGGLLMTIPLSIYVSTEPGKAAYRKSILSELGGKRYYEYESMVKDFESEARKVSKKG